MTTFTTAPSDSEAALLEEPSPSPKPATKKSIWQLELTRQRVKRKELMHFSRQLAVFVKAGIPIIDALESISEEMGNKRFKEIVSQISSDLSAGSKLSDAADRHP